MFVPHTSKREARGAHPAHPALGTSLYIGPISVGTIERHSESLDIVDVSVGPNCMPKFCTFGCKHLQMSKGCVWNAGPCTKL